MGDAEYTFAQARARLEDIVTQVRKKDMSLETSLDLLEEGVRLANTCTEQIDQSEWRTVAEETGEAAEGATQAAEDTSEAAEGATQAAEDVVVPRDADPVAAAGDAADDVAVADDVARDAADESDDGPGEGEQEPELQ